MVHSYLQKWCTWYYNSVYLYRIHNKSNIETLYSWHLPRTVGVSGKGMEKWRQTPDQWTESRASHSGNVQLWCQGYLPCVSHLYVNRVNCTGLMSLYLRPNKGSHSYMRSIVVVPMVTKWPGSTIIIKSFVGSHNIGYKYMFFLTINVFFSPGPHLVYQGKWGWCVCM